MNLYNSEHYFGVCIYIRVPIQLDVMSFFWLCLASSLMASVKNGEDLPIVPTTGQSAIAEEEDSPMLARQFSNSNNAPLAMARSLSQSSQAMQLHRSISSSGVPSASVSSAFFPLPMPHFPQVGVHNEFKRIYIINVHMCIGMLISLLYTGHCYKRGTRTASSVIAPVQM